MLTPKKGSPLDPRGLRDLERAVIEAARVVKRESEGPSTLREGIAWRALFDAIDALEAAEKGDE